MVNGVTLLALEGEGLELWEHPGGVQAFLGETTSKPRPE